MEIAGRNGNDFRFATERPLDRGVVRGRHRHSQLIMLQANGNRHHETLDAAVAPPAGTDGQGMDAGQRAAVDELDKGRSNCLRLVRPLSPSSSYWLRDVRSRVPLYVLHPGAMTEPELGVVLGHTPVPTAYIARVPC
jgi:hypothetical protein